MATDTVTGDRKTQRQHTRSNQTAGQASLGANSDVPSGSTLTNPSGHTAICWPSVTWGNSDVPSGSTLTTRQDPCAASRVARQSAHGVTRPLIPMDLIRAISTRKRRGTGTAAQSSHAQRILPQCRFQGSHAQRSQPQAQRSCLNAESDIAELDKIVEEEVAKARHNKLPASRKYG